MSVAHRARLALVAILAVVAISCGDDDGADASDDTAARAETSAAADTTAATAETTAPAATTAPSQDDQALADSLVLTEDDMGTEWTATPSAGGGDDGPNPLSQCASDSGALEVESVAEADSPDFALGSTQISSSSSVFADEQTVADQLAVFTSPQTPACVTALFEEQIVASLPDGVTIEGFGFEAIDFEPVAGTGYAFQGGGTIVASGEEQPFTIVILGDSVGRAGVSVLYQFLGDADTDLVTSVWDVMEDKLSAAEA